MRRRTMLLGVWAVLFIGCGGQTLSNPFAATCSDSCYKLEGSAQAECLSRCAKGR